MDKKIYSIDLSAMKYVYLSGKSEVMFNVWVHRNNKPPKQYRNLTKLGVDRVRRMQDALYERGN